MNTDDLRRGLTDLASNQMDTELLRRTLNRRLVRRKRRQRTTAMCGVVVVVVVVAGAAFLAKPAENARTASSASPSAASPPVLSEFLTTMHTAVDPPLAPTSALMRLNFSPVITPITVGADQGVKPAISANGDDLFVTWTAADRIDPESSSASMSPRPAAASIPRGYGVTDRITDLPWAAPTAPISHIDRTLTYRGKGALLSTYPHDGLTGRWLSWPLVSGHYIHAWMAAAPDDATVTAFADSMSEQPRLLDTQVTPRLTLNSLTRQSVSVSGDPQSLTHTTISLCPVEVSNPADNDSPKCLYVQAKNGDTTGGPCSDPHAPAVQVPVRGQNVVACPSLQQATLYMPSTNPSEALNVFVQAPKAADLSPTDLAALAVSVTLTA